MRASLLVLSFLFWVPSIWAETICDTLPEACHEFTYILRVKARKVSDYDVSVLFADSSNVVVRVPSLADAADARALNVPVTFTASDDSRLTCNVVAEIDAAEKGYGLKLSGTPSGLAIEAGGTESQGQIFVPDFDTSSAGFIRADIPEGVEIIRHTLRADGRAPRQFSEFESMDSLRSYLSASANPREGFYFYLDKDIPVSSPASISAPEKYKFAVVEDPDSKDYLLLYLDGDSSDWTPLEIKARLSPTIFIGHYDLMWLDSSHRPLTYDTFAQFNENASILTLNFPLLKASFRLSRLLP